MVCRSFLFSCVVEFCVYGFIDLIIFFSWNRLDKLPTLYLLNSLLKVNDPL